MVDSVDDFFKSSRSVQGYTHFPNLEVLDVEEQNAQKEDRFLRGRQIACMIYVYFRVTGAHDTVLNFADLFTITLRNDDVQEFDTRWGDILLSLSKIPSDDVLESLYKLRIRESDQLKTVLSTWKFIRKYLCPIIKN